MTTVNVTRSERLDSAADKVVAITALAQELFSLVDVLNTQIDLGRALTDPSLGSAGRAALATELLGKKLDGATVDFVRSALGDDWAGPREFCAALQRQATRIALRSTDPDLVRTQLNAVREVVLANDALRSALAGHSASAEARLGLVRQLLDGKVDPVTTLLVERCVRDGERVDQALLGCMELASQVRGRGLARVTVARPLPAYQAAELAEQLKRLYGQPVDMAEHVDESVIGGVRIEMGDDVIDGTVASKLSEARQELV